ncbi:MAG: hypothetical protein AAGF95_23575 [Chloroflexota bacterium]
MPAEAGWAGWSVRCEPDVVDQRDFIWCGHGGQPRQVIPNQSGHGAAPTGNSNSEWSRGPPLGDVPTDLLLKARTFQ